MALHLVNYRADTAVRQYPLRLGGVEVGEADASHQTQVHQLLHLPPGIQVVHVCQLEGAMDIAVVVELLSDWHVHQVEIDVVQIQVAEAETAGALYQRGVVVNASQLGGHKDVTARYNPLLDFLGDGLADLCLVLVDEGGVDVPVAYVEGMARGLEGVRLERLPGAQSEDRHLAAVAQLDSGSQICHLGSEALIISAVQIGGYVSTVFECSERSDPAVRSLREQLVLIFNRLAAAVSSDDGMVRFRLFPAVRKALNK